jgi:PTS system galactitol-specific IIA component
MANKVLELLVPDAVCLNLTAADSKEVIDHLSKQLLKAGYVHESFADAALAREQVMPTGLPLAGDVNAAIPHTDIEHVIKCGLALATLKQPVVFHNMVANDEEVQVRLVFVMALDQPKAQIEMLREIASVLQRPEIINNLMKATNYEDVRAVLEAA